MYWPCYPEWKSNLVENSGVFIECHWETYDFCQTPPPPQRHGKIAVISRCPSEVQKSQWNQTLTYEVSWTSWAWRGWRSRTRSWHRCSTLWNENATIAYLWILWWWCNLKARRRRIKKKKIKKVTHTLQQPGVKGDDSHHLHSVVGQDDPKAEQQEGDVLIDTGANDVQRGDDQHDQQQRRLVAGNRRTCREEHWYSDIEPRRWTVDWRDKRPRGQRTQTPPAWRGNGTLGMRQWMWA